MAGCKCKTKKVYGVFLHTLSTDTYSLMRLFFREEQANAFALVQNNSINQSEMNAVVQVLSVEA